LQRATEGRQALLELVRMKPDLIILDWTLDDIRPWDEEDEGLARAATPAAGAGRSARATLAAAEQPEQACASALD